jgi:signal transduction histidine kinase
MEINKYLAAPIKLLTLFVVLSVIPLATLGWLGWRMLEQDRTLENQRLRERLENAAGLLTRELDRGLAAWESVLPAAATGSTDAIPAGAVLLVFDSNGILNHRGVALPYYPVATAAHESPGGVFATTEAQEFREENLEKAAASYRVLASTEDRPLRAAALMRLARCLRKLQQTKEALSVYGELAALGETNVAGSPSELVARHERIALFKIIGDQQAGERETALLAALLSDGRLLMDRATFEFYTESISQPPSPPNRTLQLAEAVEGVWPLWQQQASGASGRTAWTGGDGGAFAAVWRPLSTTSTSTAAIVGSVDTLMGSTAAVAQSLQVQLALEDPAGRVSWGGQHSGEIQATKTSRESGLPWTLHIASIDPAAERAALASRQNLLTAGFGLMVLVIATASYFVFRALNRELGVARLQADFVAAVSHEFRTPLTAMRHLTDMLEEGGTPQDRLSHYYEALGKETRRRHTTVESLLDFGSMESGRRTYRMADTSATELAEQVVEEFRDQAASAAHRLELHTPDVQLPRQLRVRADRDALALALRNLLDNAIKYSPASSTVTVSVECQGDLAGISVQDEGAGIPREERRDVFRRFVRGTSARILNVKGTGIGLAMAAQIVKAHGGRLELDSEPGRGSRFTILLPLERNHA